MPVTLNSNLPLIEQKERVNSAVLKAMGERKGDWFVDISEGADSPSWKIEVRGPRQFLWTQDFFGPDEQSERDEYLYIRSVIENVVSGLYIRSVRLKNFRCFETLELSFDRPSNLSGRWTCIAGVNGAGKSSVLQAIAVALLGSQRAQELGGDRLNRMRRLADLINRHRAEVHLVLATPESDREVLVALNIDNGRTVGTGPYQGAGGWRGLSNLLFASYGSTRNVSPVGDSVNKNLGSDARRQITLFDPLSQLAGAEALVASASSGLFASLFKKTIKLILGDAFAVDTETPGGFRFTLRDENIVQAPDLPEGFRSVAAWVADLCLAWCEKQGERAFDADPEQICGIVLIDEIDVHLHPKLQREIVPRLRVALPNVQWIVTTHSPLVLANFDVAEIVALDHQRNGNVRELDRQILGFTSDQICEWLMETPSTGLAIEEKIKAADAHSRDERAEVARMLKVSPEINDETARRQIEEFQEILKSLRG